MPPNRGTDYATERRQIREREENDGIGTLLESLFEGMVEVFLLALPALVVYVYSASVDAKFSAFVSLLTLGLGVGVLRDERFGPTWPPLSPALVLARFVCYNAAVWLSVTLGALLGLDLGFRVHWSSSDVLGLALVAVVVSLVAVAAIPSLARALWSNRR